MGKWLVIFKEKWENWKFYPDNSSLSAYKNEKMKEFQFAKPEIPQYKLEAMDTYCDKV